MSWLRHLSRDRDRDRSSKTSDGPQQPSNHTPRNSRPQNAYGDSNAPVSPLKDSQFPSTPNSQDMLQSAPYKRRSTQQDQRNVSSPAQLPNTSSNGTMHTAPTNLAPAPDPLTRAFNDALKPYAEQIDLLQNSLDDANQQIRQLEKEKSEIQAWIDKRGLRPDLPASIASGMSASPLAASSLSSQLDRKMSMLNYSLHHLADYLPTPLPSSTVTSTLLTLLPSIAYLSTLPSGPAFAFESLIKLAGNANSHNTGDDNPVDRASVAAFYSALDSEMIEVIRRRLDSGDDWDIRRDISRLEKTSAFLRREMNLENYFVKGLEFMREENKWHRGDGATRLSDESR